MKERKKIIWIGSSKKDLLALSKEVQGMLGYGLNLAQQGLRDTDTKILKGFGGGSVIEIIKSDPCGTYRAVYSIRFEDVIYVLHIFQKKSKAGIATPKTDIDLIKNRLKDALKIHRELYESS